MEMVTAGDKRSVDGQNEERKCRICFEEDEEEGNSFISPCACQGSQKHVHQQCLQAWQRSVQLHRPNHPDQVTPATIQVDL
jgi:E3 ubiquitin-protein ligase DOA10